MMCKEEPGKVMLELNNVLDNAMIEFKRLAQEMLVYQFDDNLQYKAVHVALKMGKLYKDLLPLRTLLEDKYPQYQELCTLLSYVNLSAHTLAKAESDLERDVVSLARGIKKAFNDE